LHYCSILLQLIPQTFVAIAMAGWSTGTASLRYANGRTASSICNSFPSLA
jgi:hypothetical protein